MHILLWRHAEAEDGFPDEERKLTRRGEEQAKRVAKWLQNHGPKVLRVVASPATRTQQTVSAFAKHFETDIHVGTSAQPEDIFRATGCCDRDMDCAVLVVGHQPTLGRAAARLLTGRDEGWPVRKGSLWWIRRRDRNGVPHYELHTVVHPELLD